MGNNAGTRGFGVLNLTPDFVDILQHFDLPGRFVSADRFGNGHINETYKVRISQSEIHSQFALQRINSSVFPDPIAVSENICRITSHICNRAKESSNDLLARQHQFLPIKTKAGYSFYRDTEGQCWRVFPLIDRTRTFETAKSALIARRAAAAFGYFQFLVYDLPEPRLTETIAKFHNTPTRYAQLREALQNDTCDRAGLCIPEIDAALSFEESAGILTALYEGGELPERVVHNDAKINNVLFDDVSERAVCIIDLDTVMPGLALFDFADLVRTGTMTVPEDETDLEKVTMDMVLFESLVDGYLSTAGGFLTEVETEYLPLAAKTITIETGLRFLTDYLAGDEYFRIHRPEHNLDRCRTQFALAASIDSHLARMRSFTEAAYLRLVEKR